MEKTEMEKTEILKIAICDDNNYFIEKTVESLRELYPNQIRVKTFNEAKALKNYIFEEAKGSIDILFLDIELYKENGIEAGEEIQEKYPHIQIAYITAYINYASAIFQTNPAYFLVKPIQEKDLKSAMDKMILKRQTQKSQIIAFASKKGMMSFYARDILYVEGDKREVIFALEDERLEKGYGKVSEIEEELPSNFLRCHQSYIINMDKIDNFSKQEIVLKNNKIIPISRSKIAITKESIFRYFKEDWE